MNFPIDVAASLSPSLSLCLSLSLPLSPMPSLSISAVHATASSYTAIPTVMCLFEHCLSPVARCSFPWQRLLAAAPADASQWPLSSAAMDYM